MPLLAVQNRPKFRKIDKSLLFTDLDEFHEPHKTLRTGGISPVDPNDITFHERSPRMRLSCCGDTVPEGHSRIAHGFLHCWMA